MTIAVAVKVHDGVVLAADSAASIMDPHAGAHGHAAWVYNNANKVFRFMRVMPVGGVVWGAGSIGNVSISTLARDLTLRFGRGDDPLVVQPLAYTMQEVAEKTRTFFFEEKYLTAYPNPPVPPGGGPAVPPPQRPSLGLLIAGFSKDADLAEIYRIEINDGVCPAPILAKRVDETGYLWYGQPEALNRLLLGYDARLRSVFEQLLQQGGVAAAQLVFLARKLAMNSCYMFCEPLTHLLIRPSPLKRVGVTVVVFRPGGQHMGLELLLALP